MAKAPYISDEKIQEYIDGRLDEADQAAMAAYLLANPDHASEIQKLRQQNEALKGLGHEVLSEPVPERLTNIVSEARQHVSAEKSEAARRKARRRETWAQLRGAFQAAAVIMFFAVGALAGWFGHSWYGLQLDMNEMALRTARDAYRLYGSEPQYSVEFDAERENDFSDWIERVFKRKIGRPALEEAGYRFIGGRILPWSNGQQALYLFENDAGSRIGIAFWPSENPPRHTPSLKKDDSLGYRYWWGDGFGYALLSDQKNGNLDQLEKSLMDFYKPPS